ncbi:MAG: response regulator [Lachnospiraceae bacterium]|nr:response regulator [Lachnospiraceae bacterium]
MEQKTSFISKILEVFALCFLAVIIFLIIRAFIPAKDPGEANTGSFDSETFNEGWVMDENGSLIPVTLPRTIDREPGSEIIIRNTLPDNISDGMTLMFRTSIEDIYIYIDGKLRESYASSEFKRMAYHLPSAYVVTEIGGADAGREIEVRITVKDKGVLNEIRLSSGNNAWFEIIRENIVITVIASIVAILGLVTVALFFLFYKRVSIGRSVLYLGLLMTDMGLWSLSESRLRQIVFERPSLSTYFAYFSMELAGVLACMFLNEVQAGKNTKRYLILESLMSLQIIVNVILSLTHIAELYQTLIFSHIWFIIGILIIIYNIVTDIFRKQTGDYVFVLVGMSVFVLFAILELVNFYINPFRSFGAYICTGLLFLLVFTLVQETNRIYRLRLEKSLSDAANKAKSDFLASMSHEIRTPINAVLGMNELILRETGDPQITEYAENIETAGSSLMDIINDILDLSKIESGKLDISNNDYDPALVLNDACTMIEKRAVEKGLRLRVHVDRELPSKLRGDDKRLRQILVNLLTNAVKYTEEGQITLTVNLIKTEGSKAYLNVSVKDTGIGIRPEDRERLFESFTRLDDKRTKNVEGTGLGLSIVSGLLDLMGSKLKLESIYGKGSDFYFDLIQEIADETPIGDYAAHVEKRSVRKRPNSYIYAPGARILVIDDRPLNLAVVKGFLKNSEMIIDGALSGEEGILLMKENHYDMVFFDHILPGLDGIETYKKCLKEGILSPDFPAVMITANAIEGAGNEYLEAGFCDYISKPFTLAELTRVISKHLPEDMVSLRSDDNDPAQEKNDSYPQDNNIPDTDDTALLDVSAGLKACMNDRSVYKRVIEEFLKERNDVGLKEAFEAGDWKKYRVVVHSMKAGANYTGAGKLHDLAYDSEAALKRNDYGHAEQNHTALLALYEDTKDALMRILE